MDTDGSTEQRIFMVRTTDRRLLVPIVQVRILAAEQLLRDSAEVGGGTVEY
jgi:hypothetical protein